MLPEELGVRIRSQRERLGLKQQDLANALQVSPQAVSKWERGENSPDVLTSLGPLARLLGVSTDWLLGAYGDGPDVFQATVLASSVTGAYEKSLAMAAREFAAWANGFFLQLTEAVLRHDGVPIKYMGDQFLCFFAGREHERRAVEAALLAKRMVAERLKVGLSAGEIYLGAVGHPDYSRPDVMGEVVNIAFLTMEWAELNTETGLGATKAVTQAMGGAVGVGRMEEVRFRSIDKCVQVNELRETNK